MLHHHNVRDAFVQLVYYIPVSTAELASLDTSKKLDEMGETMTMMGAISFLESEYLDLAFKHAAKNHYKEIRRK